MHKKVNRTTKRVGIEQKKSSAMKLPILLHKENISRGKTNASQELTASIFSAIQEGASKQSKTRDYAEDGGNKLL
jgi:hypothetical protein